MPTTMMQYIEYMPCDVQDMIYEKIVYSQPFELMNELKKVIVFREISREFRNGECPSLKPTMKDFISYLEEKPELAKPLMKKLKLLINKKRHN
jgi:hypothetical protein